MQWIVEPPRVTCRHFFLRTPSSLSLPRRQQPRILSRLANEAQAAQAQVEDEQGVYCKPDPVLHDTAAAQDADASRHRPGYEHEVDGDPGDLRQVQRRQQGGDDDRE